MEKQSRQEPLSEGARVAEEVIEAILKARKLFKMYPPNNPIYINAFQTVYEKFNSFFLLEESLQLRIAQNQIFYLEDEIYQNPEKDDNLALFLFKDGVKELTFIQGISPEELSEFLRILSIDFEKEAPDDDIVTVLWEKDFEHINLFADDVLLTDEEMAEELRDADRIRENTFTDDNLKRAYQDSLDEIPQSEYVHTPLTQEELQHISKDIELQEQSKEEKFITILFELLHLNRKPEAFRSVVGSIKATLKYCITKGDFRNAADMLSKIRKDIHGGVFEQNNARMLESVFIAVNSSSLVRVVGEVIESSIIINESDYIDYIQHLGKNAIQPFMQLLGELDSVKGRRLVTEALSVIGSHDIITLASGLKSKKWNVVRDTIFILGKIGSTGAFEYIVNNLSHPDERVRREVVRTIGNMQHPDTHLYLAKSLNDSDSSIRIVAARQLANIRTNDVKKIFLAAVSGKDFAPKEFSEKKVFYGILTNWPEQEVKDFLVRTLKSRKIWNRTQHDETRAFAAYALGVLMDRDSIPLLTKTGRAANRTLRESSLAAIKKMTP